MSTENRTIARHETMKMTLVTMTATALLLFTGAGWAADENAEATIRLMGAAEAELPDAVTKQISIPLELMNANAETQQRAVDKAEKGLINANERPEPGEKGQLQADDARDRGAEMSEKARENREDRGRSEDRPEPPQGPPDGPPGQL